MIEYERVARECIDLQNQLQELQERNADITYSLPEAEMNDEGTIEMKIDLL